MPCLVWLIRLHMGPPTDDAGGSGGGMVVEFDNRGSVVRVVAAVVSLVSVTSRNNTCSGSGGGIAVSIPIDVQQEQLCFPTPTFLQSYHSVSVDVVNSTVDSNAAISGSSSGGGIFLGPGGSLTLSNTSCVGNSAVQFGGGLALGTGVLSQGSCGLRTEHSALRRNVAHHGGSQVYVACSAGTSRRIVVHEWRSVCRWYDCCV